MVKNKWRDLPSTKKGKPFDNKRVVTSLDESKREGRALIDDCILDRRSNIDTFTDRPLVISDVIFFKGVGDYEDSDDFGDRPFLGLVLNTGEIVKTGSSGLMSDVTRMMGQLGEPPWKEEHSFMIEEVKLKGKNRTYNLKLKGGASRNGTAKKNGRKGKRG